MADWLAGTLSQTVFQTTTAKYLCYRLCLSALDPYLPPPAGLLEAGDFATHLALLPSFVTSQPIRPLDDPRVYRHPALLSPQPLTRSSVCDLLRPLSGRITHLVIHPFIVIVLQPRLLGSCSISLFLIAPYHPSIHISSPTSRLV